MLSALDWTSKEFYYYLAAAGAVLVFLSVALYAIPGSKLKVPGIALSIVGGVGVGIAAGIIVMEMYGWDLRKPEPEPGGPAPEGMANAGAMPPMMGMPAQGRGGRGGRGGGGPNYKQQLATLVNKLDVLTEKPLTVNLSDEQRKEVKEQLKGLADTEELSDDDAKARFEKLQAALKNQTDTLEAAGYRWPGQGGGGFGGGGGGRGGQEPPKNPFTVEPNKKHLQELTGRLDK